MLGKCCAITGHRPHKFPLRDDETDSRCVALKAVLAEQIAALVNAGFTQFLSGMAEATDTWFSLDVLSLREQHPAIKLRWPSTTENGAVGRRQPCAMRRRWGGRSL